MQKPILHLKSRKHSWSNRPERPILDDLLLLRDGKSSWERVYDTWLFMQQMPLDAKRGIYGISQQAEVVKSVVSHPDATREFLLQQIVARCSERRPIDDLLTTRAAMGSGWLDPVLTAYVYIEGLKYPSQTSASLIPSFTVDLTIELIKHGSPDAILLATMMNTVLVYENDSGTSDGTKKLIISTIGMIGGHANATPEIVAKCESFLRSTAMEECVQNESAYKNPYVPKDVARIVLLALVQMGKAELQDFAQLTPEVWPPAAYFYQGVRRFNNDAESEQLKYIESLLIRQKSTDKQTYSYLDDVLANGEIINSILNMIYANNIYPSVIDEIVKGCINPVDTESTTTPLRAAAYDVMRIAKQLMGLGKITPEHISLAVETLCDAFSPTRPELNSYSPPPLVSNAISYLALAYTTKNPALHGVVMAHHDRIIDAMIAGMRNEKLMYSDADVFFSSLVTAASSPYGLKEFGYLLRERFSGSLNQGFKSHVVPCIEFLNYFWKTLISKETAVIHDAAQQRELGLLFLELNSLAIQNLEKDASGLQIPFDHHLVSVILHNLADRDERQAAMDCVKNINMDLYQSLLAEHLEQRCHQLLDEQVMELDSAPPAKTRRI